MQSMFSKAGYSGQIFDISSIMNWNVSNVTDMSYMFDRAAYNATTWNIGNLSNWDTSKVTTMKQMFSSAGYNVTTWNSIGTLKVYATDISSMFSKCIGAKATVNIYSNPTAGSPGYSGAFSHAAKVNGALITVNYSGVTTNINDIVATKQTYLSNVVKGVQLD